MPDAQIIAICAARHSAYHVDPSWIWQAILGFPSMRVFDWCHYPWMCGETPTSPDHRQVEPDNEENPSPQRPGNDTSNRLYNRGMFVGLKY